MVAGDGDLDLSARHDVDRLVPPLPFAAGVPYDPPVEQSWGDRSIDDVVAGDRVRFTQRLDQWVADARIDDAADQRSRERWLRSAAEQDATFGGVLLDLAERRGTVAVLTTTGRRHHGAIEAIGADFVALRKPSGGELLIAQRAIAVVRAGPTDVAGGERVVTTELRLVEVLGELAADRAHVFLVAQSADGAVTGELRSVGIDVATVRSDGDPPTPVYVRTDVITEVGLG